MLRLEWSCHGARQCFEPPNGRALASSSDPAVTSIALTPAAAARSITAFRSAGCRTFPRYDPWY